MPKTYYLHDFSIVSAMPAMIDTALANGLIESNPSTNIVMGINSISSHGETTYIVIATSHGEEPQLLRSEYSSQGSPNGAPVVAECDWGVQEEILQAFSRYALKTMPKNHLAESNRNYTLYATMLSALRVGSRALPSHTAVLCPETDSSIDDVNNHVTRQFIMFLEDNYALEVIILT